MGRTKKQIASAKASSQTSTSRPRGRPRKAGGGSSLLSNRSLKAGSPDPTLPPGTARCSRGRGGRAVAPTRRRATTTNRASSSSSQASLQLAGTYELHCPTVEDEWSGLAAFDEDVCTLELLPSSSSFTDESTYWGAYDLHNYFTGAIRSTSLTFSNRRSATLAFAWRGRSGEEGEMRFAPSNRGEVSIDGDGSVSGYFGGMYGERLEFWGQRVDEEAGTSEESLVTEWKGYNESAYESERRSRWG